MGYGAVGGMEEALVYAGKTLSYVWKLEILTRFIMERRVTLLQ